VLGLTFKEDVPDLRNSRVIDVVRRLEALGHVVTVHDPKADRDMAREEYDVELDDDALDRSYDLVIATVAHAEFRALAADQVRRLAADGGCVADLKGIWRGLELGTGITRWTL